MLKLQLQKKQNNPLNLEYYVKKYAKRNLPEGAIVSRFAPSPTGYVHMGSLLTAFYWSLIKS